MTFSLHRRYCGYLNSPTAKLHGFISYSPPVHTHVQPSVCFTVRLYLIVCNSTPSTNTGQCTAFLQHWLDREVRVKNPQEGQLSGRKRVYLSMDSPHVNYPLLKASSVRDGCSVYRRKLINDSGYFLPHQTPFKRDAMTVGEISCCIQVLLVMYANPNLSLFSITLHINYCAFLLFPCESCHTGKCELLHRKQYTK